MPGNEIRYEPISPANADSLITLDSGEKVRATFPAIVSASRSTDIPAFYSDWFFGRLQKGYSAWKNAFNGKTYYVGYRDTKFIVFWSKNPRPLLEKLDYLKQRHIGCYIQYSLNDYETGETAYAKTGIEKNVPSLSERIDTFKRLVDKLGNGAVIWRFDPLALTDKITAADLLERIERIGDQIHDYTERLVFSFVDINQYKKVRGNLSKAGIKWRDWKELDMRNFARELVALNKQKGWNLQLATCGEVADLDGIAHSKCVDGELILRLCPEASKPEIMKYLGVKAQASQRNSQPSLLDKPQSSLFIPKDSGQRPACGCAKSKDIGQYDTCIYACEYCYANASKEKASENYGRHTANPDCETITGEAPAR